MTTRTTADVNSAGEIKAIVPKLRQEIETLNWNPDLLIPHRKLVDPTSDGNKTDFTRPRPRPRP